MCLTFFYISPAREDNLIKFALIFNREENLFRPTESLNSFSEDINIFGGRDGLSKGSWLALNVKTKNIAFLTNRSSLKQKIVAKFPKMFGKYQKSRGILINEYVSTNFLKNYYYLDSDQVLQDEQQQQFEKKNKALEEANLNYFTKFHLEKDKFPYYNLLCGNLDSNKFKYYTSVEQNYPLDIGQGFFTMSSADNIKQRTERQKYGIEQFSRIINGFNQQKLQDKEEDYNNLISDMRNLARNQQFQKNQQKYFQQQKNQIPIFIPASYNYLTSEYFGTKCTSCLVFTKNNKLYYNETLYNDLQKNEQNKQLALDLN